MAKRTYPQIDHGVESWDALLEQWRQNLIAPIPLGTSSDGTLANLLTEFPANQNDIGLAAINDATAGVILALSNNSTYRKIGVQAAAVLDIPVPSTATAEDCANKINELMASLRTAGLLTP